MATDSIQLEGMKAGYHGQVRVTPVSVAANTRVEVPGEGTTNQLLRRKTLFVQNTCTSGVVWVGGDNVGYTGDEATCSGVKLLASESFAADIGRARVYVFNPEAFAIYVKVMEIS